MSLLPQISLQQLLDGPVLQLARPEQTLPPSIRSSHITMLLNSVTSCGNHLNVRCRVGVALFPGRTWPGNEAMLFQLTSKTIMHLVQHKHWDDLNFDLN